MKIISISDTHNKHLLINQNYFSNTNGEIDMIIHSGDITSRGIRFDVEVFLNWFSKLPFKYKIFCAGNHDFYFEQAPEYAINHLLAQYPEVIYLNDTNVVIDGLKIHGSPITPWFLDWAFNRVEEEIQPHWDLIPLDTDILVTHGPIYGYLDRTIRGENVGCRALAKKISELKQLKMFQFGHIHEAYGTFQIDNGPKLINASILNANYEVYNKPIITEIWQY